MLPTKGMPENTSETSAITTVIPANTTAPPAVAAARAIDSRISIPSFSCSLWRGGVENAGAVPTPRPRDHARTASRGRRARDRLAHLHPVLQLQLVAGDDEQRVVDPDAEADHRRKRGGDAGHVDDVTEQLDDGQ